MKIIYLDTETTGVDPVRNDLTQIAGIIEIDGKEKERFNLFVKPINMDNISPEALELTHKTMDELLNYPTAKQAYEEFTGILGKYVDKFDKEDKFVVAGYNVEFDLGFLRQFFYKNGDKYFGSWFKSVTIDPLPVLRFLAGFGKVDMFDYKLGTVCKNFGFELDAHDAFNDIVATKKVIEAVYINYIK